MENKSKYLIKNIGLLTISNFASKILVFLLVPLYTSVLSPSEYGVYDLVITTISFVFPVLTGNILDAVMRFSLDKESNKETVARIGLKVLIANILLFSIGLLIILLGHFSSSLEGLYGVVWGYYAAYSINQYLNQLAQGREKVSELSIAGVIGTLSMIASNVVFLLVFKSGLKGFFIANILAQVISSLFLVVRLKISFNHFWGKDYYLLKEMLSYSIPLVASVIGWLINNTSDKYVVAGICGLAASGILSISYKIPQIIGTLQNIFLQAWQISAVKEFEQKDVGHFYGNTFCYVNLLMSIACSGLILFAKPLAYVLYAKEFFVAWKYVPFLLISCVFNNASGILGSILAANKNTKILSLSTIIGAVVNLGLNYVLISLMGIQGATIATMISSFVIYQIRYSRIWYALLDISTTKVLLTWVLLIAQGFLGCTNILWYAQICIIMLIITVNKNELLSIFKRFMSFRKYRS